MSEIPERVTRYRIDNGGFLQEHSRGNLVEITSAVPAIREQVLADAKARIEDLHYGDDNLLIGTGYQLAVNDALAALTQPQTEKCEYPKVCGGLCARHGATCPDGGGAATAAGVADADLDLSIRAEAFKSYIDLTEDEEMVLDDAVDAYQTALSWEEPGPYAKAFMERVCPVPEFPGIKNRQEDQA